MPEKIINYLGPPETFTEQAAKSFANDLEGAFSLVPHRTLARVIAQTASEKQWAVIPYYNLLEGLIQESLDLLVEHGLSIFGARQIPVRFAFGGYPVAETNDRHLPESDPVSLKEPGVYSHPKALAQCSAFLQENYPNVLLHEATSTAQGVQQVACERSGFVIARREALEKHHIPVLNDDIGNRLCSKCNYTEFLLVAPGSPQDHDLSLTVTPPSLKQRRTFVAIIPTVDHVGLLADILGQIAFFGINLLKIHSRPAFFDIRGMTPQLFYLEMDIVADDPDFRLCMETLNMRLSQKGERGDRVVRILGSYELEAIES